MDLNREFSVEKYKMAEKHPKKWSTFLNMRKKENQNFF